MLAFFVLLFIAFVLFMIVSGWFNVGAFIAHASRTTRSSTSNNTTTDDSSSTSPSLFDNKPSEAEIQHQVAHHGLDAHGEALVRHHGMDGHTAAIHSGSNNNDPNDPTKGGGGFGGGGIGGI